ncbi:DUF4132 domain-containing protein [Mycolicibacterium mucogenicum]|uniref:DUF4132 domain-containing protein n=1 Tax=Mycolicibacterium mucogenicum TaxID=56689 RepID=UPI00076A749F|nr:DUF4132 domain-containing protein [Mycolicibacterium mucogenicum]
MPDSPLPPQSQPWRAIDAEPLRPAVSALLTAIHEISARHDLLSWVACPHYGAADVDAVLDMLSSDGPPTQQNPWVFNLELIAQPLAEFTAAPGVDAAVLITVFSYIRHDLHSVLKLMDVIHAKTGGPDLTALAALLNPLGWTDNALAFAYARGTLGRDWPDADVLPLVTANAIHLVDRAVNGDAHDDAAPLCFTTLAALPAIPVDAAGALYAVALGPKVTHRKAAQAALAKAPDRRARIYTALADKRQKVRLAAAQWLTTTGDAEDRDRLEVCLRAEPSEAVRSALLDALDAIGHCAANYLTPEHLIAEAASDTSASPAELSWLLWEQRPPVRWAADGKPVPDSVIRWLVKQASRSNTPIPDAGLRHHVGLLDRADRAGLGDFLLDGWIMADEFAISSSGTEQQTVSAIKSKGVLALVAACASPNAATVAAKTIHYFDTMRMAQCCALMTMLAHLDGDDAARVLASMPAHTKSARLLAEATTLLGELPARYGWSPETVADRTVSDAGFDADGRIQLAFGDQPFFGWLQPDLDVTVTDSSGASWTPAQLSAVPIAGPIARRRLTQTKEQLKLIVAEQTDRLRKAMHDGRPWAVADWQRFVLGHPVTGRLARRVVWAADTASGPVPFVVSADGAPVGVDGGPVPLPEATTLRVARAADIPTAQHSRWRLALAAQTLDQFTR